MTNLIDYISDSIGGGIGQNDKKVDKETEAKLATVIANACTAKNFRYGNGYIMAFDGKAYRLMTDKEIEILVVIADKQISIINKDTRTDVRMSLNMDKFNFNNYIKKLVTKKVLQQVDRLTLKVNPWILHILKHDSVNLSFI